MRRNRQARTRRVLGDEAEFGIAAAHDVRLQDRDFSTREERLQVVMGEMVLAADHGRLDRIGDAVIALEVVSDHRFFQPGDDR